MIFRKVIEVSKIEDESERAEYILLLHDFNNGYMMREGATKRLDELRLKFGGDRIVERK